MGTEIDHVGFGPEDYKAFAARLKEETELFKRWWREGELADEPLRLGLELETWLVDSQGRPSPSNQVLLDEVGEEYLAPELSRFNLEINSTPVALQGAPFQAMGLELRQRWLALQAVAAKSADARLAMIGILPTVKPDDLCLDNMSDLKRYRALNEQVLLNRNRRPIHLDIEGERDHLQMEHPDVMLESAATSLQLHLQVSPANAPRFYNAAAMVSAATVALASNSPFLFGRSLWQETRIPLFEQAVSVSPVHGGHAGPMSRVTFGSGYARDALYGFFVENRQHYPILLPVLFDEPAEKLPHLRLQNGTVWRWNRPLVDFGADGRCHLRIEHRVMSAGPTVTDMMANAAFYYGVCLGLVNEFTSVDAALPFLTAEANFYRAARHGLDTEITWWDGRHVQLSELIRQRLLPLARDGLIEAGVDEAEARRQLAVIEGRLETGQTGAVWQQRWVQAHGEDYAAMLDAYIENQESDEAVHTWSLS